MERSVLLIVLAASLCTAGQISLAADWVIVPGVRVGPITGNTRKIDLKKIYGENQVTSSNIDVGEGETEPGTILFSNEKAKTLYILWTDESHVKEIRILDEGTKWKTERGITIGTPLRIIEQLNKGPVIIAGFGWDYSGTIMHSKGGACKELGIETDAGIHGRTLLLRLGPDPKYWGTPEYKAVIGDQDFKSDHPAMQKLNPTVYEMIVSLR